MDNSSLVGISKYIDYDPYGMLLVGSWSVNYWYGFNDKEMDPETYGQGNVYDYGFRIYNPRLGKFLSMDPLSSSFPWYTPY
jgi:RHS repeat-associated protein